MELSPADPRAQRTGTGPRVLDALVIGAGFGGLGAALGLVEAGLDVALVEALDYPGGCAATFKRDGYRFEAGATLVAGLGEGQLFSELARRHGLELELEWLDPLIELRAQDLRLPIRRRREDFERELLALPGAPREALRRSLARQRRVADLVWPLLARPELLPPLHGRSLLAHARSAPRLLRELAPLVGRTLEEVLRRDGAWDFSPLRLFADASCQITVQCSAREAEAPLALVALDHVHRGAAHLVGGVGTLPRELVRALRAAGGEVRFTQRVRGLERTPVGWRAHTRHGPLEARAVVANLVPAALSSLLGSGWPQSPRLSELERDVAAGWGACMLYRAVRAPRAAGDGAAHLQLVLDAAAPLVEGNHVFVSISSAAEQGRAPGGLRTLTASTHLALERLRGLDPAGRARRVAEVQARMAATIAARAPEWAAGTVHELSASPRTFERFTGRPAGAVGGIPRRAGLANYRRLTPRPLAPGLFLVGDSVFPGQSALATFLGGLRTAEAVRRALRAGSSSRVGLRTESSWSGPSRQAGA